MCFIWVRGLISFYFLMSIACKTLIDGMITSANENIEKRTHTIENKKAPGRQG